MTTDAAHPGNDPQRLLSNARDLALRVRRQQRATWFPLLIFGALTLVSVVVRPHSGHYLTCRALPAGPICKTYTKTDLVYWPIALVAAYVAIAAFYLRRSRAQGLGTRVRPYVVAGIIIAVVLIAVSFWEFRHPLAGQGPWGNGLPYRLASPGTAIGLALVVLAWAERNRILFLLTLAYLVVVLVPVTFGPARFDPPWYAHPAVAQGSVLLLGGIGFVLAQRPLRSPAP